MASHDATADIKAPALLQDMTDMEMDGVFDSFVTELATAGTPKAIAAVADACTQLQAVREYAPTRHMVSTSDTTPWHLVSGKETLVHRIVRSNPRHVTLLQLEQFLEAVGVDVHFDAVDSDGVAIRDAAAALLQGYELLVAPEHAKLVYDEARLELAEAHRILSRMAERAEQAVADIQQMLGINRGGTLPSPLVDLVAEYLRGRCPAPQIPQLCVPYVRNGRAETVNAASVTANRFARLTRDCIKKTMGGAIRSLAAWSHYSISLWREAAFLQAVQQKGDEQLQLSALRQPINDRYRPPVFDDVTEIPAPLARYAGNKRKRSSH